MTADLIHKGLLFLLPLVQARSAIASDSSCKPPSCLHFLNPPPSVHPKFDMPVLLSTGETGNRNDILQPNGVTEDLVTSEMFAGIIVSDDSVEVQVGDPVNGLSSYCLVVLRPQDGLLIEHTPLHVEEALFRRIRTVLFAFLSRGSASELLSFFLFTGGKPYLRGIGGY